MLTTAVVLVPSAVDPTGEVDDDAYNFIRRLCQVVMDTVLCGSTSKPPFPQVYCSLSAVQLCALWHHNQGPVKQPPSNLDVYLTGLLKFTEHDRLEGFAFSHLSSLSQYVV